MTKRRAYVYLAHPGRLTATYRADQEQMVVRRALWKLLGDVCVQVACCAGDTQSVAILRAAVKPWLVREILLQEWEHAPLSVGQFGSQPRLEAVMTLAVKLGLAYPNREVIVAIATCELPLAELITIRPVIRSQPKPGDILVVSLTLEEQDEPTIERVDFLPCPLQLARPRRFKRPTVSTSR